MMRIVRYVIIAGSIVFMFFELYKLYTTPNADFRDPMNYLKPGIYFAIILIGLWGNYQDKKRQKQIDRYNKRHDL